MQTLPQTILDFDREHLWHPYTSMRDPLPVYEVARAQGVRLCLADGRELIDGMASWWSAIHGYSHPFIISAIQKQASSMAHVMFGGITHRPAVELAKRLIDLAPHGLDRVFLADSGSVSVEVGMKMAYQYWLSKGVKGRTRMLTVRGGYHGDTFRTMSVCDPEGGMHQFFKGIVFEHLFAPKPEPCFGDSWEEKHIEAFAKLIRLHTDELAAVILEPVVQGAGGMRFYSPEFLSRVRELCDETGILLIADEIATGFGRSGQMFACDWAGISPDIMCVGKALTGGTMTLAATLANRRVSDGISNGTHGILNHGPTFMGNPLACAAANASLELLVNSPWEERVDQIEGQLRAELSPCAELPTVQDVRVLGAIGVIECRRPADAAAMQQFFVDRGVWVRPFGRLVYIMPPYIISPEDLSEVTAAMADAVAQKELFT
ncbi:adenosylmethionine--8-amino-7-oxononanoate transaminase [Desulfovibrio ferrophilus]|uniref:Adenosylmethionine-8-amino-7-oxononanoate aminotransferase n=1 Tax=Desulfovibrio ferrophilus TaxID=241368 RepID=A0A2Z6AY26_9BACT|nr:adenosylmethionine--8-amino-7-oxononanoate transaminase [Desulfovibrio ferrophilus]BBD08056.1 adenosylmethionine-8-amino-7-oxononanoateaminotransferase [Desulfovibrio ferrophilus]